MEERMSYKQHAIYEKVFYLYGSTCKLVEPVRPTEWQPLAETIWAWAKAHVTELVRECSEGFLPPPPVPEPEEDEPPADNTHPITVAAVDVMKRGTTNGRAWTLSRVRTTAGHELTTFAGSRYEPGKTYDVVIDAVTRNGKTTYRIMD